MRNLVQVAPVLAEKSVRKKRLEWRCVSAGTVGAVLSLLWAFLGAARSVFRTQRELANLALRQQLVVLIRTLGGRRLRLVAWERAYPVAGGGERPSPSSSRRP